jgi:hypothetical protein
VPGMTDHSLVPMAAAPRASACGTGRGDSLPVLECGGRWRMSRAGGRRRRRRGPVRQRAAAASRRSSPPDPTATLLAVGWCCSSLARRPRRSTRSPWRASWCPASSRTCTATPCGGRRRAHRSRAAALDLRDLRRELEALPWVYRAELRRRFPDTLEIRVVEQVPIARWGDGAFLNHEARVVRLRTRRAGRRCRRFAARRAARRAS